MSWHPWNRATIPCPIYHPRLLRYNISNFCNSYFFFMSIFFLVFYLFSSHFLNYFIFSHYICSRFCSDCRCCAIPLEQWPYADDDHHLPRGTGGFRVQFRDCSGQLLHERGGSRCSERTVHRGQRNGREPNVRTNTLPSR